MLQREERQETEVMPKAKRRTFTAKYKREIVLGGRCLTSRWQIGLRGFGTCEQLGRLGALLFACLVHRQRLPT